jgi:hypothetical protein
VNNLRWKLKTFPGKAKERTGYVLERCVARCGIESVWEPITIEDSNKTLVFDQYPLGQAVPLIKETSVLVDHENTTE